MFIGGGRFFAMIFMQDLFVCSILISPVTFMSERTDAGLLGSLLDADIGIWYASLLWLYRMKFPNPVLFSLDPFEPRVRTGFKPPVTV
jgi:hypothetical protein